MRNKFLRIIGGILSTLVVIPLLLAAVSQFTPVISLPDIAALQALGNASLIYPNISVRSYSTGGVGGGVFTWENASTATGDHCNIFAATGVTTGRWFRQIPGGTSGIPVANCGGIPDFVSTSSYTDNVAAFNFARTLIEAAGKYQKIIFGPGKWGFSGPIAENIVYEGIEGRGGQLRFDDAPDVTSDLIHIGSSDNSDPEQHTSVAFDGGGGWIFGPNQNGNTTCLGLSSNGTFMGVSAMVKVKDVFIGDCKYAATFGSNAYLINFDHVNMTFNTTCVYMPSGTSNGGENISFTNGTVCANSTSYGWDIENSNTSVFAEDTSTDYNYNTTGTACQIKLVDGNFFYSSGHIEADTQQLLCGSSGGPTTHFTMGSVSIVEVGMPTTLLNVAAGVYVILSPATNINAAGTPNITVQSGGVLSAVGFGAGPAVFNPLAGSSYNYCPQFATTCINTSTIRTPILNWTGVAEALTAISATGTPANFGSVIPSLVYFHDATSGGSALYTVDSSGSHQIYSAITGLTVGWSSGPQVSVASGTSPRSLGFAQIGVSN